jgi:hypothetical protein
MHRLRWRKCNSGLKLMKVEIKNEKEPAKYDVRSTLELLS